MRSMARKLMRNRMMQAVPTADVVVTNPTHLAVALSYRAGETEAPQVVAKGADLLAHRIREIAREHDVPVLENKPLARALYGSVEVGDEIPVELFSAVAEVLAYVYSLREPATE
jgi:flagellar biosynthetic protein FlhB